MKIQIINGPNLNLLGLRQLEIYGSQTFDNYFISLQRKYKEHDLFYYQSNIEGEIINKLQAIGFTFDLIILNAGAYTHTSLAIADAISSIQSPVIEVHISNVFRREKIRHKSFISANCRGTISGFGLKSYELALLSFLIN